MNWQPTLPPGVYAPGVPPPRPALPPQTTTSTTTTPAPTDDEHAGGNSIARTPATSATTTSHDYDTEDDDAMTGSGLHVSSPPAPAARAVHNDDDASMPPAPARVGADFICQWRGCGLKFDDMAPLVQHLLDSHIGYKKGEYMCEWAGCTRKGMSQASRFSLIVHMRGHTGEKPFDCPIPECDRSFPRSDALSKHIKVHHAEHQLIDGEWRDLPPILPKPAAPDPDGSSSSTTRASKRLRSSSRRATARSAPVIDDGDATASEEDEPSDDETEDPALAALPDLAAKVAALRGRYQYEKQRRTVHQAELDAVVRELQGLQAAKDALLDRLIGMGSSRGRERGPAKTNES
ncbi:hypothetical protein AMAG_05180 [Allomyces macrogynus ATCC 38327]|uniref:C2H2-type domain-containing protein n=1 Tax=Allomyces macrogynus (strain ATCC 38327) TaxID=578462 RepID=A0A0L0SBE4_ALLM3|nr:hypothetical protein AMAG_05180 [Allomyces macrogynus ATCC 38327]|eukprot:KNE59715.1 hypothetical protein AMAG_05180 [Allomyces macrogynus ATCC 38327]